MPTRSFGTLRTRMETLGYDRKFFSATMLPTWWDESCSDDEDLLADVELAVARFLRVPIEDVQDPSARLRVPSYRQACLRLPADQNTESVAAAMHAAAEVAAAVVRSLTEDQPAYRSLSDAASVRDEILAAGNIPDLATTLDYLWNHGVPVVHLARIPRPKFQGMALIAEARPVIVLAWNANEPARLLFHLLHEAGHIALDHVREEAPVFDASDSHGDEPREIEADAFATVVCSGRPDGILLQPHRKGPDALRRVAWATGTRCKVDPGHLLLAWAARSHIPGAHGVAGAALRELQLNIGAKDILGNALSRRVDYEAASDTDRALLGTVTGLENAAMR